jgi:hypothetical protein
MRERIALGLAIAAAVWFGLVPTVFSLYRAHEPLAGRFDPRLLSTLSLFANVVVLGALVGAGVLVAARRGRTK